MESVTLNVSRVAFAGAVGVPLIRPVVEFNANPPGNIPEVSAHVYGPVPPLATKDVAYAAPAEPLGSDVVDIVKGAGTETLRTKDCIADLRGDAESVTSTVKL